MLLSQARMIAGCFEEHTKIELYLAEVGRVVRAGVSVT